MKLIISLLIVMLMTACSPNGLKAPEVLPELTIYDNYNREVTVPVQHNKWRLINFWATWCQPCREEMPALQQLSNTFTDQLDMLIISVDTDNNLVKEFLLKYQISIPSYIAAAQLLEQQLLIKQYPTTLLVSPQGKIIEVYIGAKEWNSPDIIQSMEQYFES